MFDVEEDLGFWVSARFRCRWTWQTSALTLCVMIGPFEASAGVARSNTAAMIANRSVRRDFPSIANRSDSWMIIHVVSS